MMYDLEVLKKDLLSLSPKDFYVKHILKSRNWYFSEYLHIPDTEIIDKIDLFKEIVSCNFGISFHSVQLVGSAKVGYSLSENKILKPFHEETADSESSDIDIAIVSERLFTQIWDQLRDIKNVYLNGFYYKNLSKSIFKGFVNEKDLLRFEEIKKHWCGIIDYSNIKLQDELSFIHPITYRIYRYWDDLEDYQVYSISKASKKLKENGNV